jgi:hypothetical protein
MGGCLIKCVCVCEGVHVWMKSALAQCLESKTGGTLHAGIYGVVPDKVCVYEGVRVCMCG